MKNEKKVIIISNIIITVLVLTIGVTYAIFSFSKVLKNINLVAGDIYMHYNETNQINIQDVMPSDTYDKSNYFEFTIDGKNTHTKYGILYNVDLVYGNDETNKVRIQDKFLNFRLVEVKNNKEIILRDELILDNINNITIYSSTIPANTTNEITRTFRLYMRIDSSVNICSGDITDDCDYTLTDWSNLFASIKVNVNGKYVEGTNFVEAIKNRYNGSGQDGLVAINTDGDLVTTTDTIREYRYSGIGDYCTYTDGTNDYDLAVANNTCESNACHIGSAVININNEVFISQKKSCQELGGTLLTLKNNQIIPTDGNLRNYVSFNNELWRIIGIFNEENASGIKEERIKLVRNEPISFDTNVPTVIKKDNITYQIYNTNYTNFKYKYFYWNNFSGTKINSSDWTKASSMYYLNEIYLTSLENSDLIENMKYYLGNVTVASGLINGKNKEMYEEERGSVICDSTITSDTHTKNCNIWYNNQASWKGKIALLYLSDLGYAASTENWKNNVNQAVENNWLNSNISLLSWFISPVSNTNGVSFMNYDGILGWNYTSASGSLRPVLSLNSQTMIKSGSGSINDPYVLSVE